MFRKPSKKELERQNRALRDEIIDMYFKLWDLEEIALDAQFVLEENRITKYQDIADDIIDRVDTANLKLKAITPDEDDD